MLRVRAHIASKASHGRDRLLAEIAQIEKDCELDETQSLYDDRPLPPRPAAITAHDSDENQEHDAASHVEHAIA